MNHSVQQHAPAGITTLDELREHLQWAIELEHATLPPYLCALYSLDPERNPEAVELVAGVFIEEMLHLALAANLLNAVGGRPRLDTPRMLPPYPRRLPHGDRDVHHPDRDEAAHYYRFQELSVGRRYQRGDTPRSGPTGEPIGVDLAGVRPMRRNPRRADHAPGSPIRTAQEEFDHTYCAVLHLLEQAFGRPATRWRPRTPTRCAAAASRAASRCATEPTERSTSASSPTKPSPLPTRASS